MTTHPPKRTPDGVAPTPVDDSPAAPDDSPTAPEDSPTPALAAALAAVGDRWTLLVINALLHGSRRFGELREDIPGIAPNILTQRLRRLEQDALVVARAYSTRPLRVTYELSAAGAELAGALRLLAGWGARNLAGASSPRHSVCGTPMEAHWWCPTCQETVGEEASEEFHFL